MIVLTTLLGQTEQYASSVSTHWLIFTQWILPIPIAASYILLAVCIWRAAKYFGSAGNEQKLLRMEMGNLAEEVHLLRQKFEGVKKSDS